MFRRFLEDQSGATAIEYGLIVSLIFLAVTGALFGYKDSMADMYVYIGDTIANAVQ